jgi:hypothetical protein
MIKKIFALLSDRGKKYKVMFEIDLPCFIPHLFKAFTNQDSYYFSADIDVYNSSVKDLLYIYLKKLSFEMLKIKLTFGTPREFEYFVKEYTGTDLLTNWGIVCKRCSSVPQEAIVSLNWITIHENSEK